MSRWQGKKVAVLMGGVSHEREVSMRTGTAMADALERKGHKVQRINVDFDVITTLLEQRPDVAVLALHGAYGEDGAIQGVLEFMRIPYTSAGLLGSSLSMDKVICKRVVRDLDIPVARDILFNSSSESIDSCVERCALEMPVVVKPVREGSTIGLSIVHDRADLPAALQKAASSDPLVMIEEFIEGVEITSGIVAGEVLPIIEIRPKSGLYDYEAKYTKGMTEYIVPAQISDAVTQVVQEWTRTLWSAFELRGMARADYIVRADGTAVFLELNTIPGMTETSLIPKAAAHVGMDYDTVCERVLESAGLSKVVEL